MVEVAAAARSNSEFPYGGRPALSWTQTAYALLTSPQYSKPVVYGAVGVTRLAISNGTDPSGYDALKMASAELAASLTSSTLDYLLADYVKPTSSPSKRQQKTWNGGGAVSAEEEPSDLAPSPPHSVPSSDTDSLSDATLTASSSSTEYSLSSDEGENFFTSESPPPLPLRKFDSPPPIPPRSKPIQLTFPSRSESSSDSEFVPEMPMAGSSTAESSEDDPVMASDSEFVPEMPMAGSSTAESSEDDPVMARDSEFVPDMPMSESNEDNPVMADEYSETYSSGSESTSDEIDPEWEREFGQLPLEATAFFSDVEESGHSTPNRKGEGATSNKTEGRTPNTASDSQAVGGPSKVDSVYERIIANEEESKKGKELVQSEKEIESQDWDQMNPDDYNPELGTYNPKEYAWIV